MHKSTAYDIEWTLTKMCSKKKKKKNAGNNSAKTKEKKERN